MNVNLARHAVTGILIAVFLSACGGGGGSTASSGSSGSSGSGSSGSGSSGSGSSGSGGSTSNNGALSLFVGNLGGAGNLDGTGATARFNAPRGVTLDTSGNIYVADTGNNTIRKITAAGVVTTMAGSATASGFVNGTASAARFDLPSSVTTDASGNIYVADTLNNGIRKVTSVGAVTTFAGVNGIGFTNGSSTGVRFYMPTGVATDTSGNVYVADSDNNAIREISPTGIVTTLAGGVLGNPVSQGTITTTSVPVAVATDSSANVYVADTNDTIIMIAPGGTVSVLAGTAGTSGSTDGTGGAAAFNGPSGLATDSNANVYVADTANNTIRMIAAGGVVTTMAGTAGASGAVDATGSAASFNAPSGVATDSNANVYVADTGNNTIRVISPAGVVTTLGGAAGLSGSTDSSAGNPLFNVPAGIAVDSSGNLYIADFNNNTIRKASSTAAVSTLAGTAGTAGFINGTGATAAFDGPTGVATDGAGNVYVADAVNNTIRKITSAGVVSTLAGTAGIKGSADGTGATASFNYPNGVAVDGSGNVYVADSGNFTIRKITSAGVVTTLAGSAGASGNANGTGSAASFNFGGKYLSGIAVDGNGNVYLADSNNYAVRMITSAGVVTTLAGGQLGSADGTGAAASFDNLNGIVVDSSGNVYVADDGYTIRKVTSAGVVTTIAGVAGKKGFGAGSLPASLPLPLGLAISGTSLYISTSNGLAVITNRP